MSAESRISTVFALRKLCAAPRAVVRRWHLVVPAGIAFAMKVPAVVNGLPYVRHTDEPINYDLIHRMVLSRSATPHFYDYPSLQYDLQALTHSVVAGLGRFISDDPLARLGVAAGGGPGRQMVLSRTAWIAARLTTATVATLGVLLVAWIATQLCGSRRWGLFAGCLAATSSIGFSTGILITPDALAGTTATAVIAMLVMAHAPRPTATTLRWSLLTGVALGLAISAKYNNALLVGAVAGAVVLLPRDQRPRAAHLGVLAAAAAAMFLLTTPGVILDTSEFFTDVRGVLDHYSKGHTGAEGDSLTANFGYLRSSDPLSLTIAAAGLLMVKGRSKWVLTIWTLGYFGAISLTVVHFDRNLTPILGSLAVLAAMGGQRLCQLGKQHWHGASARRWRRGLVVLIASVVVLPAGLVQARNITDSVDHYLTDYQRPPREWLAAQLPPGARVLADWYSPWIVPDRFSVATAMVAESTLDDLDQYDVVVLTSQGSGRFDGDPDRYAEQAAKLDNLRRSACELRRFEAPDGFWVETVFLVCSNEHPRSTSP